MNHNPDQLLISNREEILRICAKHGANNVRIFGSFAASEAGPDSDVDFLLGMDAGTSLFDLARMKVRLEDLLSCEVDLVGENVLHWRVRDRILEEAVPL